MNLDKRLEGDGMAEVETGLDEQAGKEESKRCYLCYLRFEIDTSRCIFCRWCIDVMPKHCILLGKQVRFNEDGSYAGIDETEEWNNVAAIAIDYKECIRCGKCYEVCPVQCIDVVKVEMIEQAAIAEAKR